MHANSPTILEALSDPLTRLFYSAIRKKHGELFVQQVDDSMKHLEHQGALEGLSFEKKAAIRERLEATYLLSALTEMARPTPCPTD